VTATRQPVSGEVPTSGSHLALWAGLTALFTNLAALNVLALLGEEESKVWVQLAAALITAVASAAAVYARQRMEDEKQRRKADGHET
jgi:membrane protein implicated in regulation of membrane protease activity